MGEREREKEKEIERLRKRQRQRKRKRVRERETERERTRNTTSMCELLKARAGVALSKSRHPGIKDPAATGSIFGSLN